MSSEVIYSIEEHRHRFAVWAAARATQRRFARVGVLRQALEVSGVVEFLGNANLDDIDAAQFDDVHRRWCENIIAYLRNANIPNASYGRAAKLIAIYLKSTVVVGPYGHTALARVAHPPIDRILLKNLASSLKSGAPYKKAWSAVRWTKLDSDAYRSLIKELRTTLNANEPFWHLERFWTVTDGPEVE